MNNEITVIEASLGLVVVVLVVAAVVVAGGVLVVMLNITNDIVHLSNNHNHY